MEKQKRVTLQVWALIISIFAVGLATGVLLDRLYYTRYSAAASERGRDVRMIEGMKKDLNLSASQVNAVKQVFEVWRKEFRTQVLLPCPSFQTYRQKTNEKLRALLTPEQQKRFDEITTRRDVEQKKRAAHF